MATSLSRKILIGIFVMFIISILFFRGSGLITTYAALSPTAVIPGLELWRLLTYPLAIDFIGLIAGGIAFSTPGEEMEQMLGTKQFGLLLGIMLLMTALMHMTLFYGQGSPMLEGPANLALFMLVGFVYLFPHSEIRVLFFSVRSWVILAFVGAIILFRTIHDSSLYNATPLLFFSHGGFGLLVGAMYYHVRYQKYPLLLRPIRSMERIMAGGGRQPTAIKTMTAQKRAPVQQQARIRMPFQKTVQRDLSDEERLNLLLEKISEQSYNSLTEDEKRFLRDYSDRL